MNFKPLETLLVQAWITRWVQTLKKTKSIIFKRPFPALQSQPGISTTNFTPRSKISRKIMKNNWNFCKSSNTKSLKLEKTSTTKRCWKMRPVTTSFSFSKILIRSRFRLLKRRFVRSIRRLWIWIRKITTILRLDRSYWFQSSSKRSKRWKTTTKKWWLKSLKMPKQSTTKSKRKTQVTLPRSKIWVLKLKQSFRLPVTNLPKSS